MGLFKKQEKIDNPEVKLINDTMLEAHGEILNVDSYGFEAYTQYNVKDFLKVCEMKNIIRINRGNYGTENYTFYAFDPQNGVAICTVVPKQVKKD